MEKIERITSEIEIKNLLYEIDEFFIPRLSEKVKNFDDYAKNY